MDAKTYSARLYAPQVEEVERLVNEEGLSKSEAIRKLVTKGTRKQQERRRQEPAEIISRLGWAALAGALVGLAAGASVAAGVVAALAAVLFVVSAVATWWGGP